MDVQEIAMNPLPTKPSGELGDNLYCVCSFCGKGEGVAPVPRILSEKLCRPENYFCGFCLRNNLYTKSSKHILILTFRSVFSYYYYDRYKTKKRSIYLSQIKDMIKAHEEAGLTNPSFRYDPETYLWFIDFEKIGSGKRQLSMEDTYKTIANIMFCFNFYEYVNLLKPSLFYNKYKEAIEVFYKQRSRPVDKKILNPTFAACGFIESKELPFETTRVFHPSELC